MTRPSHPDAMNTPATPEQPAAQLDRLFADTTVAFVQLHNAGHGCFSCQVDRAGHPRQ